MINTVETPEEDNCYKCGSYSLIIERDHSTSWSKHSCLSCGEIWMAARNYNYYLQDFNRDAANDIDIISESMEEEKDILELTKPQTEFINLENILENVAYKLFVAGFGSGKSTCLAASLLNDFSLSSRFSRAKIGVYAPTYDLLKLISIPYIEEILFRAKISYTLNKSDFIFFLKTGEQIILRSMDNPVRIVGFETFRSHLDELDTAPKAKEAWDKIIGRNRQKILKLDENGNRTFRKADFDSMRKPNYIKIGEKFKRVAIGEGEYIVELHKNMVSAYTTPEGFLFCYDRWAKDERLAKEKGYHYIQAPSYSNPHLDEDYIKNLRNTYSEELCRAYIEGIFTNLLSGSVYPKFNKNLHHTDETVQEGEVLHVGMDFNVYYMAAVVNVIRDDVLYALDEIFPERDTEAVCDELRDRYPEHRIIIYPDATGKGASSQGASRSDFTIIRRYGFQIMARDGNPFIKDRVISVNSKMMTADGNIQFYVNTNKCKELTDCLEQQIYDSNGKPSKKENKDHLPDAEGYLIFYLWPILRSRVYTNQSPIMRRR